VIGAAWSVWCLQGEHPIKRAKMSVEIPVRFARCASTAIAIVYDYQSSLWGVKDADSRSQIISECNQRGADRLLSLAFANGGIYIKLGQHIGQLYHLLPEEYVRTMQENVLDKCPLTSFADVRRTVREELGQSPEELFEWFDRKPIASASLAQVHAARDKAGRKLAVKVQHPGLMDSAAADIAIVQSLVYLIKFLFPSYDYSWLVREIKINLPNEANFLLELQNAQRCQANLNSPSSRVKGRVTVPEMYPELSTSRILSMEFVEGVFITDVPELKKRKVDLGKLAQLVSLTFNEMIFFFGKVHCDPHAANLIVRHRNGKEELVLLDHGLYQEMPPTLRHEYASLWHSLIFGDQEGIKRHSVGMNAGELYPIFAAMLTYKEWNDITNRTVDHLDVRATKEEMGKRQRHAREYAQQISTLLLRVPREIILLLKTNDCLRTIDRCLGQVSSSLIITARECTRALAERRSAKFPFGIGYLSYYVDVVHLEIRLMLLYASTFFKKYLHLLTLDFLN